MRVAEKASEVMTKRNNSIWIWITLGLIAVSGYLLTHINLFETSAPATLNNIEIVGRFVTTRELDAYFPSVVPEKQERSASDTYLLVRCSLKKLPSKMVLHVQAKLKMPELVAGKQIRVCTEGFLGQPSYDVVVINDVPAEKIQSLLKSQPEFELLGASVK